MISVSFIAGSAISTADSGLSYSAPSTMSAHFTSSATGAALKPNFVARYAQESRRRRYNSGRRNGASRSVPPNAPAVVFMVRRRQKGAQMVVEPPRDLRRRRILEVDNRVLVSDKVRFVEERARPVDQSVIAVAAPPARCIRGETG